MTATRNPRSDEINAVNLADEHAEEAVTALGLAKTTEGTRAIVAALCAIADGILAADRRLESLRETLNRELPDIGAAIADAEQD